MAERPTKAWPRVSMRYLLVTLTAYCVVIAGYRWLTDYRREHAIDAERKAILFEYEHTGTLRVLREGGSTNHPLVFNTHATVSGRRRSMGDVPVYVFTLSGGHYWQDDTDRWHFMPDIPLAKVRRISELFPEASWAISGPQLIRIDRPETTGGSWGAGGIVLSENPGFNEPDFSGIGINSERHSPDSIPNTAR